MAEQDKKQNKSKKNEEPEKGQLGSLFDFIKPTKGCKDEHEHELDQESGDQTRPSEWKKDSSGKRKASPSN